MIYTGERFIVITFITVGWVEFLKEVGYGGAIVLTAKKSSHRQRNLMLSNARNEIVIKRKKHLQSELYLMCAIIIYSPGALVLQMLLSSLH